MEKKNIAVLMTVHNRRKETLQCLAYLEKQQLADNYSYDVWITDDGCTDGTKEAVKKAYPYVHIVDGDGNLYWNRGMWKAWEAASKHLNYDFYLWLNDDTDVYSDALSILLEESDRFEDKCIIVGSTQFIDHSRVSYGGFVNFKMISPTGNAEKVDYFNGNIVLVPSYVFQKVGNLDPYYSHGHGDTDYGLRAKEAGINCYLAGKYLGECDRHKKVKKCWDPDVPIKERFQNLYKPTGYPPREDFYFQKKHYGVLTAISHYVKLYGRVLLPSLWRKMGKEKI